MTFLKKGSDMKAIAVGAVALAMALTAQAEDSMPSGVLAAPGGRYVFGQVNQFAKYQFLLDTQTGRMWSVIKYCADVAKPETCEDAVLKPLLFESANRESTSVTPIQEPAPTKSKPRGTFDDIPQSVK